MVASHVNVETSSVKDVKNDSKERMICKFTYKTCMKIDDHSLTNQCSLAVNTKPLAVLIRNYEAMR